MDTNKLDFNKDPRPLCKYSPKCYQKNSDHVKKYKHHPVKNFKIFDLPKKNNNKRKISEDDDTKNKNEDSTHSEETGNQSKVIKIDINDESKSPISDSNIDNDNNDDSSEESDVLKIDESKDDAKQSRSLSNSDNDDSDSFKGKHHEIPSDIDKFIEDTFLVKMPEDFHKFWQFFKSNPKAKESMNKINLALVGPFDVVRGTLPVRDDKSNYLVHWRHYYDPPEFQTIFMSTKDEYHIGYYRDSPEDLPCFVAYNKGTDCKIQQMAENIFGALLSYIQSKENEIKNVFIKSEIELFAKDIKNYANENKLTLDTNSASMKKRMRNVVAKTFHSAGIVVPYNKKTQLGYRQLIEKDDVIKKILKNIVEAKNDKDRDAAKSTLQPVLTMASIATDECDFGTGLELGIDLFCYGESILHGYVENFLSIAYNMLDRDAFGEIIKVHLANRRKGSSLSVDRLDK